MTCRETPETRTATGFAGFLLFPAVSYRLTTYPNFRGYIWGYQAAGGRKIPPMTAKPRPVWLGAISTDTPSVLQIPPLRTGDTPMPLTDTAARQAKFTGKQQKLSDDKGLYLLVNASGKYWRLKYRMAGKEKALALGVYPEVSLKEARAKRDEARKLIAEGVDPGVTRKQEKITRLAASENSLESLAREWHQSQLARWSKGHAARVLESLEADVFPDLGSLPVAELTAPLLLDVLRKIERRGVIETAGRVLQRVGAVMRYAIQTGRASYNPTSDLRGALTASKVEHRPALPRSELPEFFRRLAAEPVHPATRLAFRLLILTMTRPGEIRFARWDEFDFERAEWRIPAERMKMRTEHLVPLSRQALAVLDES